MNAAKTEERYSYENRRKKIVGPVQPGSTSAVRAHNRRRVPVRIWQHWVTHLGSFRTRREAVRNNLTSDQPVLRRLEVDQ